MKDCMPEAYRELVENCEILERHYKDMMVYKKFHSDSYGICLVTKLECFENFQDIEFTVQEKRLWMLQCRSGKRTGKGAVKIAVDLVNEGLVDTRAAVKMVEPQHLDQLLHPQACFYLSLHLAKLEVLYVYTWMSIEKRTRLSYLPILSFINSLAL